MAGRNDARSWWLCLCVITVIAAVLRFSAIGYQSVWYDEAVTADLLDVDALDLLRGYRKDTGNPPLYPIVARVWSLWTGNAEAAMRSLPALFGTASVASLGVVGRRLLGGRVSLIAAFLFAVSPLSIELSNEARTYALLQLLVILSTWRFVTLIERQRRRDALWYGALTALMCLSHYYALMLPLVHGLVLVWRQRRDRVFRLWLLALLGAAAGWTVWLPGFLEQIGTPGNLGRYSSRWPLQFLATPLVFVFGRTLVWRDAATWLLAAASALAVAIFWVPAIQAVLALRDRRERQVLLAGWAFLPILLPLVLAFAVTPLYSVRYASVGLPAFLLLAACGIARLKRPVRLAIATLAVFATTVSLVRYHTHPLKDDWRSAAAVILPRHDLAEPIVFDTGMEVQSFSYYARRARHIPRVMFGVVERPAGRFSVQAMKFENGTQVDWTARPYATEVFHAPRVWVVLCAPAAPADDYIALFESHGYRLKGRHAPHRIEILEFQRDRVVVSAKPAM